MQKALNKEITKEIIICNNTQEEGYYITDRKLNLKFLSS